RKALLYVSFSLDFLERGTFTEYPYVQHPQPLFVFQSEARMYISTHQEDVFVAARHSGRTKFAKF
uniref:hypothetical protein n=1 Tax=Bacteroides finegoldii TaxID=338188 RepID=UPI0035649A7F